MTDREEASVVLPSGHTGSTLFHAILSQAVERFPRALEGARLPPNPGAFKRDYGELLARFEAARVSAPERVEIARFMLSSMRGKLGYGQPDRFVPLAGYLEERAATPRLEHATLTGKPGLAVEIPLDGKTYRGHAVHDLVEQLFTAHQLSEAARQALHWVVVHATEAGGALDLRGHRFALLGAGAELAPTRLLLRGGAQVLWVDLAAPFRSLADVNDLSGSIVRAPSASNLLQHPREIAATIRAFASDGPVHVGMFAYAPGASREWRVAAAMDAIVSSLEPELVRSVALLISPTTPLALTAESVAAAERRLADAPRWQRALERTRAIRAPGAYRSGATHITRTTVSLQGLSYQAAQYLGKIAAAETYARYGARADESGRRLTVSANVAGITRTRSLSHPLFELAFSGADKFGVRIFEPETTRAINGWLMLHDLLNPAAKGSAQSEASSARAQAEGLLSQQVHGGIYTLPFVLEGVIRAAALVGLGTRPAALLGKARPAREAGVPEAAE